MKHSYWEDSDSSLVISIYPKNLASSISDTWPRARGSEEAQDVFHHVTPWWTDPACAAMPAQSEWPLGVVACVRVSACGELGSLWGAVSCLHHELRVSSSSMSYCLLEPKLPMRIYLAIFDVMSFARKSIRYFFCLYLGKTEAKNGLERK